ncbi:TraG/VirB4 family ATPase [Bdellovibrio svalbardensis]|uniref:TraG P-loop domain-containing protein n=1 Tax=Bdellovibrio svalbardensis TaxID=2972972 RepID=A0ABT6DKX3_9BACT|nr:hypothetical protein [Bdellovibrio svalbardensis]MDG0816481.1 hypothetical protein [Bdellovibrio svalbardensis]
MIPILSEIKTYKELIIWKTTDGIIGCGFDLVSCDPELDDVASFQKRLNQALRQLDPSIVCRLELSSEESYDLDKAYPRALALNELGFVRNRLRLYLDVVPGFRLFRKSRGMDPFEVLHAAYLNLKGFGIEAVGLSKNEIVTLFDRGSSDWVLSGRSIETGTESIGVVRLKKQPDSEFDWADFMEVVEELPRPFSLSTSFARLSEASAKILLEKKLKQLEGAKDVGSSVQRESALLALKENFKSGVQFFEMEVLVTLKRPSPETLSASLREAQSTLSLFSEAQIETFGVLPSFVASLPGSRQHVVLVENEAALLNQLPMYSCSTLSSVNPARSLSLLRSNNSLFHFDLFDPQFNAFNSIIVGPSGRGKSVLAGMLSTALLNDNNVHVIKIDVGGSHSKECELLGGQEFSLSLDKSSGLNPLSVIALHNRASASSVGGAVVTETEAASDNDKLAIVSKFLMVLIQEQGEVTLSKDLRSQVEECVRAYIDLKPEAPCLQDFYDKISNFPRRNLLRRWVRGGLYERAFAADAGRMNDHREGIEPAELLQFRADGASLCSHPGLQLPTSGTPHCARLRYFNFSQVFQASDPEFAVAGFAALLAELNSQVLIQDERRIVLMLDEVPFFIKYCFELIKFTAANMRKYGHAVVCISQLLGDLIVNGDRGIIENSPQRFLFAVDGDTKEFQEATGLQEHHMDVVNGLQSIPGVKSEVFFKTDAGGVKLVSKITRQEYWEKTSSKTDKEKMAQLLRAVPGLTMREAIYCLSIEK